LDFWGASKTFKEKPPTTQEANLSITRTEQAAAATTIIRMKPVCTFMLLSPRKRTNGHPERGPDNDDRGTDDINYVLRAGQMGSVQLSKVLEL
jgi:hypothetical protein